MLHILAAAPHRLLFFVGASNVLLAMTWWALWLIDARWHVIGLPQPAVPAGWLHAIIMQYQVLLPDSFAWHALAGVGWIVAFMPWVLRSGRIYLSARADGQPG